MEYITGIIRTYGVFTAEEFKMMKAEKENTVTIKTEDKELGWTVIPYADFGFEVHYCEGRWWLISRFDPVWQEKTFWYDYDFDSYNTKEEAYRFLNTIKNILDMNKKVTLTDLKCILGSKYTCYKKENAIGWTDFDCFWIAKLPNGTYKLRIREEPKSLA